MIEEIVDLGFDRIELSHGMTIAKLPGIRKAFKRGLFTCTGIHNFFPSPVEVMIDSPDAYQYTSHRPADRQRAMAMTLQSLESAAEFEAQYLVLHMGSAPMNRKRWTKALTSQLSENGPHDPWFIKRKLQFVKKREKISALYYQRAIESLDKLAERAAELGLDPEQTALALSRPPLRVLIDGRLRVPRPMLAGVGVSRGGPLWAPGALPRGVAWSSRWRSG